MITLWHGSRTGLNGPIRPISSTNEHNEYIPHDFGVGFYAGNKLGSAVNWVFRQIKKATLTKIEISNVKSLTDSGCMIHIFKSDLESISDWALYFAYSRNFFRESLLVQDNNDLVQKPVRELYPLTFEYLAKLDECDIIIGPIADDRMQYVYEAFLDEWLGIRGLNEALKSAFLGTQVVFKTQKACNVLNQHSEITTYKLSEFLRTDPRYKNRTLQQISNDFIKLEARMRNDVTMIKRKYKSSSNDKLINELLSEKEDKLRESMIEIDNPSDLDPRELGR